MQMMPSMSISLFPKFSSSKDFDFSSVEEKRRFLVIAYIDEMMRYYDSIGEDFVILQVDVFYCFRPSQGPAYLFSRNYS